ncbi:TdeIII family type II restriction endonuclease [Crocosphaera sp. UHCC 0190]|uniref:TdeIII family type II restriction endonuclease n=1 Tax=Crocosphaera sp. UHCC 0190 TaxID=3110246 RepID=UPI002B219063|nr:TdeIII family type II restriction endonuclease [Crocosphaera sp. UHCC 0190]MEA5509153.1 TdeIII family type II restriction endonuclease [Crocosphaera sp. UHCC 0190]
MKLAIQSVIQEMMDKVMNRVLIQDPFLPEKHRAAKPLYAALVPDEIFKGSHFERRFVTPFGKVWEKLAVVAAQEGLGYGIMGHTIKGCIKAERLRRITEVLNNLEHPKLDQPRITPNWKQELSYIMKGKGENIPVQVVCDIYAENPLTKEKYAFELKAPLPNSDQTKVSKEKILKLHAMTPKKVDGAYFALSYNPYGRKEDYSWSFPSRWFDMQTDEVVLIGDEFWDKIGGLGTYQAFISAINEIGEEYKSRIYQEFLGIESIVSQQDFKI